ncbi:flippase-like domain-containing protein [Jatrophihabitans telluris]|uniref:Flippase-like domain-containing protein n=1 Tax=Jatrophihabitans telluris TaxID=2038343 RepID=A0ABY4QY47_9ACTN|nr:lysylphosphatidylglycerol synthase transmembrane domain-containing protein [Jatrophihabitans telluris]UQX88243.1 flippase-like domain-containing protein [Jatrophihabitans telluris]
MAGEDSTRHWHQVRQIVRPTLGVLALLLVINYVLLPQIAGARKTIHLLSGVNVWWLVVAAAAEIASLLAYVRLSQLTLRWPSLRFRTMSQIDLSTLALSHVVPAGSLVGVGVGYALIVRAGVPRSQAVTGKTVQTVGSAVILNVILAVGLCAALVLHGSDPLYGPIAAAGLVLLVSVAIITVLVLRRQQRIIELLTRLLSRLPHVDPAVGQRLVSSLADTLRTLGRDRTFLRQTLLWATLNWMLDALSLWCSVRAFGHALGPVGLVVAYGLANVAAALPFTPGGLGIVEGILVPTLVAFNTTRGIAILGVLAWRLFSFWIPIPIGLACYAPLVARGDHTEEPEPDGDEAEQTEPGAREPRT